MKLPFGRSTKSGLPATSAWKPKTRKPFRSSIQHPGRRRPNLFRSQRRPVHRLLRTPRPRRGRIRSCQDGRGSRPSGKRCRSHVARSCNRRRPRRRYAPPLPGNQSRPRARNPPLPIGRIPAHPPGRVIPSPYARADIYMELICDSPIRYTWGGWQMQHLSFEEQHPTE